MTLRSVIALTLATLSPTLVIAGQQSTLLAKPPRGAIVLFDGKDLSKWWHRGSHDAPKWDIVDGNLIVKPGTPDLVTKQEFGDYQLHLEFWIPFMVGRTSQARGNSGVYNQGRYEVQVLDNFHNPTYDFGGCGSIYGLKNPDKDAIKQPMEWNTYDITFRAPRLGADGKVLENPRITVIHNGIKIHDNVEITLPFTTAGMDGPQPATGPLMLQDHSSPVRYRNIWIKPLKS